MKPIDRSEFRLRPFNDLDQIPPRWRGFLIQEFRSISDISNAITEAIEGRKQRNR